MWKSKLTEAQVDKLVKFYKDPSIKLEKLCDMFQVSEETIRRAMKRRGVPMRVTVGFNGQDNSNWKGGYSLKYAKNMAVRFYKKNECMICGYKTSTDVHHLDKNRKNNTPDNLVLLCPNHHREAHLGLFSKAELQEIICKA